MNKCLVVDLIECPKKFQAEQPSVPNEILPQHACCNWRSLAGDQAGRNRGWGGNGQLDILIKPEEMRRGDTGPCSAYIERLRKLNEIDPGRVSAAQENRDLEPDTRGVARLGILHALPYLIGELRPHSCPSVLQH
jgi:hypothetical protein